MQSDGNQKFSFQGFVVWGICAVFFLYEFLLRTIIGTFQIPIMQDLGLNSFKFSILSTSMYLLIYGAMQIPVGLITDRYGLKKSLFCGSAICALSAIGFAYTQQFSTALVYRIFTGLGSSFGFVCLLISVYEWMPRRHVALLIGLSQLVGTLGPMIAAGPTTAIAHGTSISWRDVFLFLGIFGIGLTVLIVFFVKECPQKQGAFVVLRRPERIKLHLKQLVFRFSPWTIAFYSALVYFSIEFLSENDGKIFLQLKGFGPIFSSFMLTIAWIGFAAGCPLAGFISDRIERRKGVMLALACVGLIAISVIVTSRNRTALIWAFFLLGIGASGQSVGFALIAEHFKEGYLAVGLALNNSMITVISAINAPLIGLVLDSIKTTTHPTLVNYETVLSSLIVLGVGGVLLALFFIKENFGKSTVDLTKLTPKRRAL